MIATLRVYIVTKDTRVEVLDPHSDVSAALFNKVHVESPNRMIEDTVKKIASCYYHRTALLVERVRYIQSRNSS